MQVAKWGNSLAIRLPAAVVEALELKAGDEIEIHVAERRDFGVARKPGREELLKRLRAFRGTAAGRFQVRPGRGECPVASSTPTSCSISRRAMPRRRTGPNSDLARAARSACRC